MMGCLLLCNTDTDELIDMKERKAVYDKAMEPINADDVVVKFVSAFESEWEVLKITNMLRDDVGKMLKDVASLDENDWDGNYLAYMEKQGAETTLLASSSKGLNGNMPDFWDYEYDFDAGVTDEEELSVMQYLTDYALSSRMEPIADARYPVFITNAAIGKK